MKIINSKKWLIILGMHRSGTSSLTGTLATAGINVGQNLLLSDKDNEKGYYEHQELMLINELLLNELNAHWFFPFHINRSLVSGWVPSHHLQNRMRDFLMREEFSVSTINALKDPRLCVLLPFWQTVFKELNYSISYLLIYRSPQEVIKSLIKRNKLSFLHAEWLWREYNIRIEAYTRKEIRCWLSYDDLLNNPLQMLEKINAELQLNLNVVTNDFVDPKLKHHYFNNEGLQPLTERVWAQLQKGKDDKLQTEFDLFLNEHNIQCSPLLDIFNSLQLVDTAKIKHLNELLSEKEHQIQAMIQDKDAIIQASKNSVEIFQNSLSWRITAPLRAIRRNLPSWLFS